MKKIFENNITIIFLVLVYMVGVAWAADTALVDMAEDSTLGMDSIIYTVDDPAGTPADRKVTIQEIADTVLGDMVDGDVPATITRDSEAAAAYQPLESTLTDIADGAVVEDLDFSANPMADNEIADAHSHAADAIDAITEIAAALKSGSDGTLMTGTAGTSGNCAEFDANGDIVDAGTTCGGSSGDNIAEGDSKSEVVDAGTGYHQEYTDNNTDVADAGEKRLPNDFETCWEASPAGTDTCFGVNSDEEFYVSVGGTIVWKVTSAGAQEASRSATPKVCFGDSDATDDDDNVCIEVNCTDTGSGTEDCDFTFQQQIAGTLTDVAIFDADGNITFPNTNIQPTTVELGHASDTTLARSSAGVVSVEGVVIPSISSSNTLTNKTLTTPVITLEQSTNPTNTTDGRIQWDSDDDMAVMGDGAAASVIATKTYCFEPAVFYEPDELDASTEPGGGVFPVAHINSNQMPGGFTITSIMVKSSATCTDAINIEEWSNNGTAWAEDSTTDAITMSGTETEETTITDSAADADDTIMVDFPASASDVDWVSIQVCGTINTHD